MGGYIHKQKMKKKKKKEKRKPAVFTSSYKQICSNTFEAEAEQENKARL